MSIPHKGHRVILIDKAVAPVMVPHQLQKWLTWHLAKEVCQHDSCFNALFFLLNSHTGELARSRHDGAGCRVDVAQFPDYPTENGEKQS